MKHFFKLLIFLSLAGETSMAATITGGKVLIVSVTGIQSEDSNGASRQVLKFCTAHKDKKECEQLPEENDFQFRGTPEDWKFFFNRCKQYEHLNTLTDITQAVMIMVLPPIVGKAMGGAKLGFWTSIAGESAFFYAAGSAYPEIEREAFEKAEILAREAFTGKKDSEVPSQQLVGLKRMVKACLKAVEPEMISTRQGACMRGCHGNRSKNTSVKIQKVPFSSNEALERQNVEDYLGSVAK